MNANKQDQFELEEEDFTEEEGEEDDDDDDDDEEEEENVKNSADNESNRSHRACKFIKYISGFLDLIHSLGSRTERERLEDGIVSEAKRMISFDFVIK